MYTVKLPGAKIAGWALCLVGLSVQAAVQNRPEMTLQARGVDECVASLQQSATLSMAPEYILPEPLRILSWNIYKAGRDNLLQELSDLAAQVDVVFLQEAFIDSSLTSLKPYWRFSPGYIDGDLTTGVLTLSHWPALVHCQLVHQEPLLRTPKATGVVEYLTESGRLLAINLHAVNFEFGLDTLTQQLSDIARIIDAHAGPVVFAGDFNTWSESRNQLLNDTLHPLGLEPADFAADNRTTTFGYALDHIWTRGVTISASEVPITTSSDHNPLFVTFHIMENSALLSRDKKTGDIDTLSEQDAALEIETDSEI